MDNQFVGALQLAKVKVEHRCGTRIQTCRVSKHDLHYLVELPPGNGVELTLKNVPVLEKYRMFASLTFFSAACGLTISSPCTIRSKVIDALNIFKMIFENVPEVG